MQIYTHIQYYVCIDVRLEMPNRANSSSASGNLSMLKIIPTTGSTILALLINFSLITVNKINKYAVSDKRGDAVYVIMWVRVLNKDFRNGCSRTMQS